MKKFADEFVLKEKGKSLIRIQDVKRVHDQLVWKPPKEIPVLANIDQLTEEEAAALRKKITAEIREAIKQENGLFMERIDGELIHINNIIYEHFPEVLKRDE